MPHLCRGPRGRLLPSPGPILRHRPPSGPGIRNDCGIREGGHVPVEYDPILSKLCVAAPSREAARRRMIRALESYVILGITTTIPFLIDVLKSDAFTDGQTTTDFIHQHFTQWKHPATNADLAAIACVAKDLLQSSEPSSRTKERSGRTPWDTLKNWRL
ncbi:MAG: hypothetical protein U5R49_17750 [Deltaproteobacteria bacterium]|nr:hypothetical protein [Deltaproteobacteria bacterium]